MSVEETRRENERLHKMMMDQPVNKDAEERRLSQDNIRMRRKLGENVPAEEILRAKGIKVKTAREWHEGNDSE